MDVAVDERAQAKAKADGCRCVSRDREEVEKAAGRRDKMRQTDRARAGKGRAGHQVARRQDKGRLGRLARRGKVRTGS